MFIRNELKEFMEQMEVILEEKFPKYKDTWRIVGIGKFREKIDEQMKKISTIIMTGVDWDRDEVRRKLIHVANLCMLLENRLRKD